MLKQFHTNYKSLVQYYNWRLRVAAVSGDDNNRQKILTPTLTHTRALSRFRCVCACVCISETSEIDFRISGANFLPEKIKAVSKGREGKNS